MYDYYRVIAPESSLFYQLKKRLLSFDFYRYLLLWLVVSPVSSLFFVIPVHALSVTTAKTITGTEPSLMSSDGTIFTSLNQLSEFSMPNRDGKPGREVIDVSMASTAISVPDGMKFSDISTLVAATGTSTPMSDVSVFDADGDVGSATGTVKVTWKNNGEIVPLANQNQRLSTCEGPYTLEITVDSSVSAQTLYGDPRTKIYGTSPTVKYTLVPSKLEICYIQPTSMNVYTGIEGTEIKYANGYNPAVWKKDKGFAVYLMSMAGKTFPTTGFNKATFTITGSGGNQSKYKCEIDTGSAGNWVTLSTKAASATLGRGCQITYNTATRPTTSVKLNMLYTADSGASWTQIGSYTIPTPDKWALPLSSSYAYANDASLETATSFPMLDACRAQAGIGGTTTRQEAAGQTDEDRAFRQKYVYRRDELTNGPFAYGAEGTLPPIGTNYFSRDVDGTFMGEWGWLDAYDGTGWTSSSWYWMSETWSTTRPFAVTFRGDINNTYPNVTGGAACRG